MTQSQQRSTGLEGDSEFPSTTHTSAPTSSISFFLSVLSFCCLVLASYWLYQNDFVGWYRSLPVIDQCCAVTVFALFALGFAATVREVCADNAVRWTARGIGLVGVVVLVAFSVRTSLTLDRLENKVAAQTKAKSVSEQHGAAVYQVTLKSGQVIELDESNARSSAVRSLPHLAGRSRTGCLAIGAGHGADSRQHASIDPMPLGQSWQWAAAEPTGTSTDAAAKGHSPDF